MFKKFMRFRFFRALIIAIKEDYFYDDLKRWGVRQYVGTVMMFVGLAMILAVMIMFCVCR